MSRGRALALAIVCGILCAAVLAPVIFIVVMVIAGPHAGLLPQWLEAGVLVAGWLALLAVPIHAGRWMWQRLTARRA